MILAGRVGGRREDAPWERRSAPGDRTERLYFRGEGCIHRLKGHLRDILNWGSQTTKKTVNKVLQLGAVAKEGEKGRGEARLKKRNKGRSLCSFSYRSRLDA